MSYKVELSRRVQKALIHLPAQVRQRITVAVTDLQNDPRPFDSLKLKGKEGWRIRVGDYRIIYSIDDGQKIVSVSGIGHRREIYDK